MLQESHRNHLRSRGFSDELIDFFAGSGAETFIVRSLTNDEVQEQWLDAFPAMRESDSGALLLRFNSTTYSLRPDNLIIDGEHKKYLYSKSEAPGLSTQPWVPTGEPYIATEGLFDALAATYLMDTPCCGTTAPSHLGRSKFPDSVKVYISDADVPFHHAESLLAMQVGLCRERGYKIAHLPRNPHASYVFSEKIPEEAKWGMEEWAKEWGSTAKDKLKQVIGTAKSPVPYLQDLFNEYKLIGIAYPENQVTIANGARAIIDATSRGYERDALRDLLKKSTGAPKGWLDDVMKRRSESIARKQQLIVQPGARCHPDVPSIQRVHPAKSDLQAYLISKYQIRFNELTQLIELNGRPMEEIDSADQFLAHVENLEVSKQTAKDAFDYLGRCNPYNPIKEYLEDLQNRRDLRYVPMDEIAEVFGIEVDDRLSKELLGRHLVGHVVRGMDPANGKHHQMLILFGSQGNGKSRTLAAMAGHDWYDSATTVANGALEDWNFLPKINGAWVFEFDECEKLIRSTSASEFKGFVTRASDKYAEKYKSFKKDHPRRSCLWGTTNDSQVLNDSTGSRRFWVIDTKDRPVNPDWFQFNRDSFWATVITWYQWGLENWVAPDSITAKAAAVRAQQLTIGDPLESELRHALEARSEYCKQGISQKTLLSRHLDIEAKDVKRDMQMRITRIVTAPSFTTHDGMVRWKCCKKRFPEVTGKGQLVPGNPLHGYCPVPADPTVPSDERDVVTPEMPWERKELVRLFQPFKE